MKVTTRFKIDFALAGLSSLALIATLLWRDWIEVAFRIDPDHGDGSLEWTIVNFAAIAAFAFACLARIEWARMRVNSLSSY
jgi:hypothetical protein